MHFQELILALQHYWHERGCLLTQPYDVEKGAGTFNPATFLRALGPEPFNAAYVEPCRRPADGRYGDNPIRMQHYYQFQVILKPSPDDVVEQYLGSLKTIGIKPEKHDLRFVHDDWESPTLGAWGLGWEIWADGMEITQFTYFQQVGGLELNPVPAEITYGLERLCMFLQGVDNVFALRYNDQFSYGDLFHENEVQGSRHNFILADVQLHFDLFGKYEHECLRLCEAGNPVSAVDYCLKAGHSFNLLDARGAISVNERQNYILKVRTLARTVAEAWLRNREELGFPLLERAATVVIKQPPPRPKAPALAKLPARAPLLLELGVEEMPAQVFKPLLKQLPELFQKYFGPSRLDPQDLKFFVTPRRLAVSVASLKTRQDDQQLELKGPPLRLAKDENGNWTKAAEGFAKKAGIDPEKAEIRQFKGEEYLFAVRQEPGQPALEVLGEIIPQFFGALHWYKTMRWGLGKTPFVRPVRWLAALLGDTVIPCEFAGVWSGAESWGHRFRSNTPVKLEAGRTEYLDALRARHVIADQNERKAMIRHQLDEYTGAHGLTWREDLELLDEVANLVEYPVPVGGAFDEKYLRLPATVLITEMKKHQRCFACLTRDGSLSNRFMAAANMLCEDMNAVAEGCERVLSSRFADAEFFLKEDSRITLEKRLPQLDGITFQTELGSIGAKVTRLAKLAAKIGAGLGMGEEQIQKVNQIARLCKTDLTTSMVAEFPELQGEIGRYYAELEGLEPVVADGIREHYLPKSLSDELPATDEAAAVGLADRIDSLVGIAAVAKLPSGSADPFALRRACLTSIAIIVRRRLHLDLRELLETSFELYGKTLAGKDKDKLISNTLGFYLARAKGLFREKDFGGFSHDMIDAVAGASVAWYDLSDFVMRVEAMETFRRRDDFADVAATFKRANNIIGEAVPGVVDPSLFRHDEEKELLAAVEAVEEKLAALLPRRQYVAALAEIGPLRELTDRFFDAVLVNDENQALRANRHRLVQRVVHQVLQLADFSAIQEASADAARDQT